MTKDLKENYIELDILIEDECVNQKVNLLGILPVSTTDTIYLYPFINEKNSTLYIDNKKIDKFSPIQTFPHAGTFKVKIEISEILSDLSYAFCLCVFTTKIDLSHLNMENVITMEGAFSECQCLEEINLGNINADKIINLTAAFRGCLILEKIIGIEKLNTSQVIIFEDLFNKCKSLKKLDLSNWNTQNAINMSSMFFGCENLVELNLENWDARSVTNMRI